MRKAAALAAGVLVPLVVAVSPGSPAGAETAAKPNPKPKPNIVVIMTDDQWLESMRVMQNVRRLMAEQGATFANAFASYPLCCPSRATYLSGQYAHNHGVMGNAPPYGGYEKWRATERNSLPVWLRNAGYRTLHIGKYLNGYGRLDPAHVPAGWSEWYGAIDPWTYRYFDYRLNENGRVVAYGAAPGDYQADVYTRQAVAAIRRLAPRARPFFLSVGYLAPHWGGPAEPDDPRGLQTPHPAPRHRDRYAKEPLPAWPSFNEADVDDKPATVRRRPLLDDARIAAITESYRQGLESLLSVDEGVAAIVDALRRSGELANTYVLYVSDNGYFHGQHRIVNEKVYAYEPSVRIPLVLRGPGIPRNVGIAQQAMNVDLAATIVDMADARPGRRLDGISLLPLIRSRDRAPDRDVLIETPTYTAVHTARYVYVEHRNRERELYDLEVDPYQLVSQHRNPAYAAVRADLTRRLARLERCKGAQCRAIP